MTRRGLFGILGAAVAAATLDPDRLLWVPGKKLISIPAPRVFRPGPVRVSANWPEDDDRAAVLQALMNHRYAADPLFRTLVDREPRSALAAVILETSPTVFAAG